MYVATVWLIWGALRQRNPSVAAAAAIAFAASPWIARQTGYILSETLSTFLAASLLFLVERLSRTRRTLCALAAGVVSAVLPLTSQATVVLALGLFLAALWTLRPCRSSALALLLGAFAVLLPWQLHCVRATGRIQPLLYSAKPELTDDGLFLWIRTWRLREPELVAWWHPEEFARLPDRAFVTNAQRLELERIRATYPFGNPVLHDAFRAVAQERIRSSPLSYYLALPAERAVLLWFDMPDLGHFRTSYALRLGIGSLLEDWSSVGARRAVLRLIKESMSVALWVLYALYPLSFAACGIAAIRSRDPIALAVVAGALVYTLISGWSAMGESRRNAPFFPGLLYTWLFPPMTLLVASVRRRIGSGYDPSSVSDHESIVRSRDE